MDATHAGAPMPVPVHYDLHVWLYRENPDGMLAAFNPDVSCRRLTHPLPTRLWNESRQFEYGNSLALSLAERSSPSRKYGLIHA